MEQHQYFLGYRQATPWLNGSAKQPHESTCFVTGAGTGIGEAISRHLHAEGYRVTLLGRRLEPLAVLAASLGEHSQA